MRFKIVNCLFGMWDKWLPCKIQGILNENARNTKWKCNLLDVTAMSFRCTVLCSHGYIRKEISFECCYVKCMHFIVLVGKVYSILYCVVSVKRVLGFLSLGDVMWWSSYEVYVPLQYFHLSESNCQCCCTLLLFSLKKFDLSWTQHFLQSSNFTKLKRKLLCNSKSILFQMEKKVLKFSIFFHSSISKLKIDLTDCQSIRSHLRISGSHPKDGNKSI